MERPDSFDDLVETLEFLDDWEERYRYIIDLGKSLEPLPEEAYDEANKVKGCMSQVWMISELEVPEGSNAPLVQFRADSDALIVKGLIAVLMTLYDNKSPRDILSVDVDEAFKRLQLEEHLSPNRRNGFFSMINRIRSVAAAAAGVPERAGEA